MLCVMDRNGKIIVEAHVGQVSTGLHLSWAETLAVEVVQADGDELLSLLNHFGNTIRTPPEGCRVARWFGNEARFIAANIQKL
jgi:hypothetical protein